jgi:hypothetical protein
MTEARVFGPIRGAGTQLNEEVGQETLEQGLLGSTLLVGVFERGKEGDISILPGSRSLARKMGGLINPAEYDSPVFADLWNPLAAQHFWDRSRGAGNMIGLRVVPTTNNASQDDRPDKSLLLVWNRETEPKPIGTIEAHNGGSWAGKRKHFLGSLSGTPGTDFPAANQVQLSGITIKDFKNDEYRNGQLVLDGLPGVSYNIVNIDPSGLITLEADVDVATAWGAGETAGSETGGVETFNFGTVASAWTLSITTETGGPDLGTFTAAAATVGGDGAGTFPLTGSGSIFFVVNGTTYEVALANLDTEAQVIAKIEAAIPGIDVVSVASNVTVNTDRKGTAASITIDDGASTTSVVTEVFSIATPTEVAGTSPEGIANHLAVTAAEIKAYMDTVVGGGASGAVITENAGGSLTIASGTTGAASTVQMAGNLITLLGFDGAVHTGTDGPSDLDASLIRSNVNLRGLTKACDVEFRDGALRADEEFGMLVRIDGKTVLNYRDLSMQTGVYNYWADVINNDPNNDVITVTDTFSGNRAAASARPANHFGASEALTASRLTIADPDISNLAVAVDWVPSFVWNSWGTEAKVQRLQVTIDPALTTATVTTDKGNRTWTATLGVALDMGDYVGSMTIDTTSGTITSGDTFLIYLRPLAPDELIGGRVYPNKTDVGQKNQNFEIIANGVDYVDASALVDMTDAGNNVAGKDYRIQWPQQMAEGYDGYLAGMTSGDFEALLDAATTPAKKIKGRGYGLVKAAAPGTAYITQGLTVSQKLKTMVAALNWCTKVEMPWQFHDWDVYYEEDLIDWVNNDLQRGVDGDYASTHFPSFAYVRDPFADAESDARNVLVPAMGLILGNEAYVAKRYEGYHKAPAGISVQIPQIVELPAVGRPEDPIQLDEEKLNPAGINVLKWRNGGRVVIQWGDRTLSQNNVLKWLHKRYLLSQYGNDLQEGFDFTIFEINDPIEDAQVVASLHDYFIPEWRKRAIRGSTFVGGQNPAAIFKMDSDNNTDATRGQGDQIVEVSLRIADTIERLRIFLGAMGVVEASI